jgi:hypothetical protein
VFFHVPHSMALFSLSAIQSVFGCISMNQHVCVLPYVYDERSQGAEESTSKGSFWLPWSSNLASLPPPPPSSCLLPLPYSFLSMSQVYPSRALFVIHISRHTKGSMSSAPRRPTPGVSPPPAPPPPLTPIPQPLSLPIKPPLPPPMTGDPEAVV